MLKTNNLTTLGYRSCMFTVIGLGLMGCQQVTSNAAPAPTETAATAQETLPEMTDKEKDIVAKLDWVTTADAKQDAEKALAKTEAETVELIAFSGRGKSFPGLTTEQYAEIEARVTYRFAEGSGDTLHGPTQKALRKDLRAYTKEYNTLIYDALTKNP